MVVIELESVKLRNDQHEGEDYDSSIRSLFQGIAEEGLRLPKTQVHSTDDTIDTAARTTSAMVVARTSLSNDWHLLNVPFKGNFLFGDQLRDMLLNMEASNYASPVTTSKAGEWNAKHEIIYIQKEKSLHPWVRQTFLPLISFSKCRLECY